MIHQVNRRQEIFPWNHNFETGIHNIDSQHRKLVDLVNLLAEHVIYNSELEVPVSVFNELAEYAVYHFAEEEAVWEEAISGDEWELGHKTVHIDFVATVESLKRRYEGDPSHSVIDEVLSFLTRWLALHILESDKRMAVAVLAIRSGMSRDDAKAIAEQEMTGTTRVLIETILSMYENLSSRTLRLMREVADRRKEEALAAEVNRRLEEQAEKLKQVNGELEQFAYIASHDLREPLRMVSSFLSLIEKRNPQLDTDSKEFLDYARDWRATITVAGQRQLG